MILGAASNFSQGASRKLFEAAIALPVLHFRDGISWGLAEKSVGRFDFSKARVSYPHRLSRRGTDLVMTFNWGNALYDGGETPQSPQALAAFGHFVAAMVERYPAITAVEVGNEINGANFVSGTVKEAGLAQRARYHMAMVRAAAEAARAVRPDITILGGSTHSLPAGFLWSVLDADDAGLLDGLAVHPYTTPDDQLAAQIAVLRQHERARTIPLHVTEHGSQDPELAPHHLVRSFAALSSLGVASLYWYPLNPRGDRLQPLLRADGAMTDTGRAFAFVQSTLAGQLSRDVSPDPFTSVHAFGEATLVLWGEPRAVALTRSDIAAFTALGDAIDPDLMMLDPERPILLRGEQAIDLGEDVVLGCSDLVADSFRQFRYPVPEDATDRDDAFRWFVRTNGRERDFLTRPGQERGGVPWVPYLASEGDEKLRLTAEGGTFLRGFAKGSELVAQIRAPAAGTYALETDLSVGDKADSALLVSIEAGAQQLARNVDANTIGATAPFVLEKGETLNVILRPELGRSAMGFGVRLKLRDMQKCD